MYDLIAVGELLIDIYQQLDGSFIYKAGGAPCNALVMATNMGCKTAFIGKVGNDSFGKFLIKTIGSKGIDTKGVILSDDYNTTLAFVTLDEKNDRSFIFYRTQTADVMLEKADIDYSIINQTKVLCFGSLSFTTDPTKSTTLDILETAKKHNKLIAYDVNYRPTLWKGSEESNIKELELGFNYATILKMSEEEVYLLFKSNNYEQVAKKIFKKYTNIKLVLISLGEEGAFFATQDFCGYVPAFETKVVDTTGAGDAFLGCLLGQIVSESFDNISLYKLREVILKSNAAAALNISKVGAIESMPTKEEVNLLYQNQVS
ncbi:carbohydrate kinase [Pseudofrancisella aestuarii]|uniref:Carbohydrate kinase n=1 Tax=Pseudofrancisella aestuarii TaxID=2670347 RepID=A0ABV9TA05_9GAMM|nr:carbohydrate kinase [Pseudofrancisella aestuarii]